MIWYAAGSLKFRASLCSQNGSPPPTKPLQKPWFICRHIATAQFCQWVMLLATQLGLFIACSGVHCGLKYQHWPMNQTLVVVQQGFQWRVYPYNSDKSNAKKSEISTKIDVYSYRRANRHDSCSAGVICRGFGVVTFNTQSSVY